MQNTTINNVKTFSYTKHCYFSNVAHDKILSFQAQLLAEMDEEFGIGDLIQEEFGHVTDQQRRPKVRNPDMIVE